MCGEAGEGGEGGNVRGSAEGSCLRFFEEEEEGFPGSAGFCQSHARQRIEPIAAGIGGSERTLKRLSMSAMAGLVLVRVAVILVKCVYLAVGGRGKERGDLCWPAEGGS